VKIAVAMSGGIDSSVAALLLTRQGHEVTGIMARFLPRSELNDKLFEKSLEDAMAAADHCRIRLTTYDFSSRFEDMVITPFCMEYLRGRTPNPCVLCNQSVKFGLLLDAAYKNGCEYFATGHYAVKKSGDGRHFISMGRDTDRDQSYFLCRLSQDQLSGSLFPLGSYLKNEIRGIAADEGLILHDKPDSQEICFIPDNDYVSFIESRAGFRPSPGDITDSTGRVIGRHSGIHRYTIGQRRGMGISAPEPIYVAAIEAESGRIIAGPRSELLMEGLETIDACDMKRVITGETRALIKTRSTQKPVSGFVKRSGSGFVVRFNDPLTGISPGQTAVFYDSEGDIMGCGTIGKGIKSF